MTSKPRIVVLGAGRVGGLIARDLAQDSSLQVVACDRDAQALERISAAGIATRQVDLAEASSIEQVAGEADVVVGAVPGAHGYTALAAALAAGRSVVDISFMPEDALALDAAARDAGVTAIVDCGVAPGLSNWFVGHSCRDLVTIDRVEILVGGLPLRRVWPYEYRAVFSPTDVVEEYTRPCRMRVAGEEVVVPALSGVERVEFAEVGSLEAFFTDGLRSLLATIPARHLSEKTLRYPGHAEKMLMLRETGFFDPEPLRLASGVQVRPRELTERLLFRSWALGPEDEEFTLLRVRVEGCAVEGRTVRHEWELFDRTDRRGGATSMARTTGFPCAIVARWLATGRLKMPGVHPPEVLGRDAALTTVLLEELRRRGVTVRRHEAAASAG